MSQVAHLFTAEELELLRTKWDLERSIQEETEKLRKSKELIRRLNEEKVRLKSQVALLERATQNDDREAQLLWKMQQR